MSQNSADLHEILRRNKELQQLRHRYQLSEKDCQLLLTNANEYSFNDGEVILKEGEFNASVYRIKSGSVHFKKNDCFLRVIGKGWFINDRLFLGGMRSNTVSASIIADGPVTICELNLPFVKKCLEMDPYLALRLYRHIASKLSSIFFFLVGNIHSILSADGDVMLKMQSEEIADHVRKSEAFGRKRNKAADSRHMAYKEFKLATRRGKHSFIKIKKNKLEFVTSVFGFKKKKSIYFRAIRSMSKSSDLSLTIVYGEALAKTFFLTNEKDKEELFEFLANYHAVTITSAAKMAPHEPLSSPMNSHPEVDFSCPTKLPNPLTLDGTQKIPSGSSSSSLASETSKHTFSFEDDENQECIDRETLASLSEHRLLKKGDFVVQEGDLFQRLFQVAHGECGIVIGGNVVAKIPEGTVFGESTLLHLRPMAHSMVVLTDEAEITTIPGFKINELCETNATFAVRIYKTLAKTLEAKIARFVEHEEVAAVLKPGSSLGLPIPQAIVKEVQLINSTSNLRI